MQRERRHDPYPWTWEPAALVGLLVVLGLVLGVQLGRSLANLIAGAGWTWPAAASGASSGPDVPSPVGAAFWRSLLGVLSGDAGAGLAEPAPHGLAGPGLVWTSVAATEAAILSVLVWAGVQAYLRWGPGRLRGMAKRAEAEAILGVTRVRKVAGIVRPDLYGKHASSTAHLSPSVHRRAGDPAWTPPAQSASTVGADLELGRGLSPAFLPRRQRGRRER